jgi:hypothetical protein
MPVALHPDELTLGKADDSNQLLSASFAKDRIDGGDLMLVTLVVSLPGSMARRQKSQITYKPDMYTQVNASICAGRRLRQTGL